LTRTLGTSLTVNVPAVQRRGHCLRLSEVEFARHAAELIRVIDDLGGQATAAAALAEVVPGIARELPPAVRDDLLGSVAPVAEDDSADDAGPWSNIGP
jgi:hypothetical protein